MTFSTDPDHLRTHNYKDSSNLKARKNLYQYEVDRIDIFSKILDRVLEKTPTSILDIACGAGDTLARLRTERNFSGLLVGIDLSPGMIATAEKQNSQDSLAIEYSVSHALALPFANNSFDAVMCNYALYHFPDITQGVQEAYRVLKPGGLYVGGTHQPHNMPRFKAFTLQIAETMGVSRNPIAHERVNTENLGPLLNIFRTIEFERYESAIRLTNPDPYLAYINSCRDLSFDLIPTDSQWHDALEIVRKKVEDEIAINGFFEELTAPGIFITQK